MHVDDGLVIGKSRQHILGFLGQLKRTYSLEINERPKQHLGYMFDWKNDGTLYICQTDFALKILSEFGMMDANPVKSPSPLNFHCVVASESPQFDVKTMQQAIGMLTYLVLHTRPDIAFTVNVLAQFVSCPTQAHWSLVKHLMQYLRGTLFLGIHFVSSREMLLCGWTDADYGSSQMTKQSTTGYVITFCANPVSWTTKKQLVVTQSTTKAEFIAINKCAKQLCWMSNLITSLSIKIEIPIIFNNNSGAVHQGPRFAMGGRTACAAHRPV
jgi:hypothetical protein